MGAMHCHFVMFVGGIFREQRQKIRNVIFFIRNYLKFPIVREDEREKQIPYASPYIWNLKKKKKKS